MMIKFPRKRLSRQKPFHVGILNQSNRDNINHRFQDGIPSIGVFESGIGEHASVPTNMLDSAILKIFEPILGTFCDI